MTVRLPGQNVPIQLPDGQINPLWYQIFKRIGEDPNALDVVIDSISDAQNPGKSVLRLPEMLQVRDGLSYGSYDRYRCYVNPGVISHG